MISTITAFAREEVTFSEILRAMFPMGSMTGAPKISAMQLIEEFEDFKRGLFSGSVGYIKPNGDFDFNVIIRSILYDDAKQLVSCPVGSAITIQSDPEKEYEECMLKVNAMLSVLNGR
jgi:para-aminobenzoate synthetase component I